MSDLEPLSGLVAVPTESENPLAVSEGALDDTLADDEAQKELADDGEYWDDDDDDYGYWCQDCGEYFYESHYHCIHCHQVSSMMGHYNEGSDEWNCPKPAHTP